MKKQISEWDEKSLIRSLKHYLPLQAPLKDFVHHNTLHAFQDEPFFDALNRASKMLGYKTSLSLNAFRRKYKNGEISDEAVNYVITQAWGSEGFDICKHKMIEQSYDFAFHPLVGKMRASAKKLYQLDLDSRVHSRLFRMLGAYLDQGVSILPFPIIDISFLDAIREIERYSKSSIFQSERAKLLLQRKDLTMTYLLDIVVANPKLYSNYLFDQQFAHPGWSGMVSFVEDHPNALLDKRKISLEDLILFELLLEIDALETKFGSQWKALGHFENVQAEALYRKPVKSEYVEIMVLWQQALEENTYGQVINALQIPRKPQLTRSAVHSFQAFFCIDDRELSLRNYLQDLDSICQTFGTPGHFGLEFYFKPENGKFYTKLCPAPITPTVLIEEQESGVKLKEDIHFSKHTHGALGAAVLTHTIGLWSGLKLISGVFRPRHSAYATSSFQFMDPISQLTIDHAEDEGTKDNLQIGFNLEQMVDAVEGVLRSTGVTDLFAPLIYMVGHGASSVNNTYYAGYDCGACCGRPGSVNARLFSAMANKPEVRAQLLQKGIYIPNQTQFVGVLHDTTRDEVEFYDTDILHESNAEKHAANVKTFEKALELNALERSRRFISTSTSKNLKKVHKHVKMRAVTLYEPRPELNHATNCLCIIGTPSFNKNVFLDRRAFANSYDWEQDLEGTFLLSILKAVAPVCGGINLEYYFSRVDNEKLGAGSKLPHNVVGLNGVANGVDGDLRPGLPVQMTELHDPLRLLVVIEQMPDIVLEVVKRDSSTYQWFKNGWINLAVIHPITREAYRFSDGIMKHYEPFLSYKQPEKSVEELVLSSSQNLPIHRTL